MNSELFHTISPVYDEHSEILILGTFPSVKSREVSFYYGHPQNRFWRVLAVLLNCAVPVSVQEKKTMLLTHHIALWDVIKSCEITGSADSTIKSVKANNINTILNECNIKKIYANGKTAEKLYNQHIKKQTHRDIIALPSTSPANASFSLPKLTDAWKRILE